MSKFSTTKLVVVCQFSTSTDKLFQAWIDPEIMKKWFFTTEPTNKLTENDARLGGTWKVIDEREGNTYEALGEYIEMNTPNRLVFSFKMPQFSNTEDRITIEFKSLQQGSEMTFTQEIIVPHEAGWGDVEISLAEEEAMSATEQGWSYMFMGLKQLVETGKIHYPV